MPPNRPPEKAADAYHQMAVVLPEWYFTTEPPESGVIVHVRGRDRVWTQWAMAASMYNAIEPSLRRRPVATRLERYGSQAAA